MDNNSPDLLTPQERGDTLGRFGQFFLFLAVTVFVAAATVAITYFSSRLDQSAPPQTGPTSASQPTSAATTSAPRVTINDKPARLVSAEDTRVWRAVGDTARGRAAKATIVLDERDDDYTLDDLVALGAAKRPSPKTIVLTKHVVLRTGANLTVREPGTTINMVSTPQRFTSIVSWGGSMSLRGSRAKPLVIKSWDTRRRSVDLIESDGRAYIRSHSGRFDLRHARVERLGFWSGRTSGLAVTGTSFDHGAATVKRVTTSHLHVGLYLMNVRGAQIAGSHFTGSERHGIQVDRSARTRIRGGSVTRSAFNGIQAHENSHHLTISRTLIRSNAGYGVKVDGLAQATGPNTQGYSTRNSRSLTVKAISTRDNARGGIRITGMDKATIADSTIDEAFRPIHLIGPSTDTTIDSNTVTSGRGAVILLTTRNRDVKIRENTLNATTSGVWTPDAALDVTGNTITVRMGHALVLGADVRGSAHDNTFKGQGPSAIKWDKEKSGVTLRDNNAKKWDTTNPVLDWIEENPFAALWSLVLLVPAIGVGFIIRRVRQHRELRRLTEETVIAMTRARRQAARGFDPARAPDPDLPQIQTPQPGPAPAPVAAEATEAVAPARVDRHIRRGAMGQFLSARDLAIHAVLEGGRSPEHVARTLQVSPAQVKHWVQTHLAEQQA